VFDGPSGQVNAVEIGAGPGEPLVVGAQPHADFENAFAPGIIETREFQNVGFQLVAFACLGFISARVQALEIEAFSAGSLVPEIMDPLFLRVH